MVWFLGIAQSLRFAPELCLHHLPAIVPALVQVATCEEAREEENEGVCWGTLHLMLSHAALGTTENALLGLGLACMNPTLRSTGEWGGVDVCEVAALWMRALPLR